MSSTDNYCDDIQQAIAIGGQLTDLQCVHLEGCKECAALRDAHMRVDRLLGQALQDSIPEGFADRVMIRVRETAMFPKVDDNVFYEHLLTLYARSRLLRILLLGLGVALGIGHVVRFFLGIFIAGMAAAL